MEELDGRLLRGDALAGGEDAKRAFESLWKAYYPRLLVFASAFRGLPGGDREDEAAEALIAAFRALGRFDGRRAIAPWIYRIARNRFASAARRAYRMASVALGPPEPGISTLEPMASGEFEARVAEDDLERRCLAALGGLSPADRRVAFLCLYEGLSSTQAGQVLGMPAGTVRWRLAAIRKRVRVALGEEVGHGRR